jgi:predicted  nucleic acid-binding Zn-ribbon protein
MTIIKENLRNSLKTNIKASLKETGERMITLTSDTAKTSEEKRQIETQLAVVREQIEKYSEEQSESFSVAISNSLEPVIAAINKNTSQINDINTNINALFSLVNQLLQRLNNIQQ